MIVLEMELNPFPSMTRLFPFVPILGVFAFEYNLCDVSINKL